jgi:taurine dioxygenase
MLLAHGYVLHRYSTTRQRPSRDRNIGIWRRNRFCQYVYGFSSDGKLRLGFTEPKTSDVRELPGPLHPIARTHPDTGRKALYLGRRKNSYIDGLELDESEALLDMLWNHASQEQFSWTQDWQIGDLIMWDNRSCMHRRGAFDDNDRRLMHRTVIKGNRPV